MKTTLKAKSKSRRASLITYFSIGLVGALFFLFGLIWTAEVIGFTLYGYVYLIAVVVIITFFMAHSVKSVNREAQAIK